MLDKTSKRFLDFLDGLPEKTLSYLDDAEYPGEFGDDDEFFARIRYLDSLKYVEIIKTSNSGTPIGVCLGYKGRRRKEFRRQEVVRYLEEKWIDFFAMFISTIALIVSLL